MQSSVGLQLEMPCKALNRYQHKWHIVLHLQFFFCYSPCALEPKKMQYYEYQSLNSSLFVLTCGLWFSKVLLYHCMRFCPQEGFNLILDLNMIQDALVFPLAAHKTLDSRNSLQVVSKHDFSEMGFLQISQAGYDKNASGCEANARELRW